MTTKLQNHCTPQQEEIYLCDTRFIAHPSGALIWPEQQTLIVADMYLASGPVWNTLRNNHTSGNAKIKLNIIKTLINTYPIQEVIALGHSFRRLDDPYHLDANDLNTLYNMQKHVQWIWAAGSSARSYPNLVGGLRMIKYQQNGFVFQAQPRKLPVSFEIAAGTYPMARLREAHLKEPHSRETQLSSDQQFCLPCFASNGKRLLMPAFGGTIAAKNILSDEFLPFFGYDDLAVQVIDKYKTFPISKDLLKTG